MRIPVGMAVVLVVATASCSTSVSSQGSSPLLLSGGAVQKLLAFASDARKAFPTDPRQASTKFTSDARTQFPVSFGAMYFNGQPPGLYRIVCLAPFDLFEGQIAGALLRVTSLDLKPPQDVLCTYQPNNWDAPDGERMVLVRGSNTIEPLSSKWSAVEVRDPSGLKFTHIGGSVHYPVEAFPQGSTVTVMVIGKTGPIGKLEIDADSLAILPRRPR